MENVTTRDVFYFVLLAKWEMHQNLVCTNSHGTEENNFLASFLPFMAWLVWGLRLKNFLQIEWYSVLYSCAYIYTKEQDTQSLEENVYVKWNLGQLIFYTHFAIVAYACFESRFSPLERLSSPAWYLAKLQSCK